MALVGTQSLPPWEQFGLVVLRGEAGKEKS